MTQRISVSKLDAAKRQMEHAIKMFFHFGDVVVIHAVTAGAHTILCDLGDKKGIRSELRELKFIRPEKRKEVYEWIREPQNFFKHSDREGDEQKTILFTPLLTQFQLYDCCEMYRRIVGETVPLFKLYVLWFLMENPDAIVSQDLKALIKEMADLSVHKDRNKFFGLLPEIEKRTLKA